MPSKRNKYKRLRERVVEYMITVGKTIYLLSEGIYVHCDDDTVTFEMKNGTKQSLAYHVISEIIIFYNTTLSSYIMYKCSEHKIIIHYISRNGYYMGCFSGRVTGNVLLTKKQFDMINSDKSVDYVRNLICCKIRNSIWVLNYFGHHSVDKDNIKIIVDRMRDYIVSLKKLDNIDDIRILEANAASAYFSAFDYLLKTDDSDMIFGSRSKRPALNNVNALLSFFYTFATSICTSALLCAGLNSECGYLHTLRSGRHSLACDLVEEFRACIVDRFVITIINRKEVVSSDFCHDPSGIRLTEDGRKKLLQKWEKYLDTTSVVHLLYNKNISLRVLFYEQAQFLAQYIRGDIDEYPAFLMK